MSSPWIFETLGMVRLVEPGGHNVPLKIRAHAVILAVLCESGGAVGRAELASIVWQETDAKSARNSLRNSLVSLRRLLGDAIRVTSVTVELLAEVRCDWQVDNNGATFLPGCDQDWVIERRLQLRTEACQKLLQRAEEAEDRFEALALIEKACAIDPLSEEAATALADALKAIGRQSAAAVATDHFRARTIRELGAIPDLGSGNLPTASHLLFHTAEWLLDRSPAEALAMMAATGSQWLAMPIGPSREAHRRVLSAVARDSAERRMVAAQFAYLTVMSGQPADLDDLRLEGEPLVAARMHGALSYSCLSRGQFRQSVSHARAALSSARLSGCPTAGFEFEQQMIIIIEHCGQQKKSAALEQRWIKQAKPTSTLQEGQLAAQTAHFLTRSGRFDKAAVLMEKARRCYRVAGAQRLEPWLDVSEAALAVEIGDLWKARRLLQSARAFGAESGGQSLAAMASDRLAAVETRLGEFESAANALASAAVFRRRCGTVPSLAELREIQETRRSLQSRLGEAKFKRALMDAMRREPGA